MKLLNLIILIHRFYEYFKPTYYYHYTNGKFVEITLVVYFLNCLIIGFFLKKFIFEDKIICEKDNNLWIYSKPINKIFSKKIIKNIFYKDNNYNINLIDIKKNIYNIDRNINISFILYLYKKIIINENSYIIINYFNYESKFLKIYKDSNFELII